MVYLLSVLMYPEIAIGGERFLMNFGIKDERITSKSR